MARFSLYDDRICAICGALFSPSNSRARACPGACRKALNKVNVAARLARGLEKECAVCFTTFTPEHQNNRTCSDACRAERQRQQNIEFAKARIRGNDGGQESTNRLDLPIPEGLDGIPDDMDAPVMFEPGEFSEGQVRKYYGLDVKEPKPYRAQSLAECEALKGRTG